MVLVVPTLDWGGVRTAVVDDDQPLTISLLGAASNNQLVYSPPPSPTRMTSISRFQSPLFASRSDTPSLMNGSLLSTISSPSLAQTPVPYTTTRDPRADASCVGLGISGIIHHDGSVFDGMGALPKRNESSEIGFFMDEADDASSWYDNEPVGYPEQEEDAWQKRLAGNIDAEVLELFQRLACSPSQLRSPQGHRSRELPRALPSEPVADDVFFSHAPNSSTPRPDYESQLDISRAAVSTWFRHVQQSALEE